MNDATLLALKKAIDGGFRSFTRAYGDAIESFLSPLQHFLIAADHFMTKTPWPIITLIILAIAWGARRSVKVVAGCLFTLLAIGYFDMWDDTMRTISMTFVITVLSIVIGIHIDIIITRSNRVQATLNPLLDVMKHMP